jgi:lipopolysaccharide export system protein LptA
MIALAVAVVFLISIPMAGGALDKEIPTKNGTNGRQITFSATGSSLDLKNSLITLTGNVEIVQGRTKIVSDNAQIFTTKDVTVGPTINLDAVDKFVANGNVGIELETGMATCEKAVYFKETKILKLSGTPAKFVSRDDTMPGTITGRSITVERAAGDKFEVNGGVRIEFEMGVATSESGIYSPETKILVLSGTPAKIVGSTDKISSTTITGRTITVNRETSMINIEKMEAVIFPEDEL